MIALVVIHTRFSEETFGRDEAFDNALGMFTPGDIEGAELWEKDHLAIGQIVMNPPG